MSTSAIERWLAAADADAERRLPGLKPLLAGMAASTAVLRAASWNERADAIGPAAAAPAGEGTRS